MEADSLRTTIRPWTSATTRVRRAAALLAMALVLLLTPGAGSASDGIYFDDSDRELLVLGSTEYYEVGLRKSNGAFAYIRDRKAGGVVSLGSEAEALWKAEIPGGPVPAVWANEYGSDGPAGNFDYGWSAERNELTLTYSALPDVPHGVTADVVLRASVGPYFDLQIAVRNGGSGTLSRVSFPHQLVFAESEMEEALLPEQPGLILQSGFFAEHRSWGNPSVFTDYLGVRTTGGSIAMYSLRSPRDFWPVHLGLAHVVEPPNLHTTQLQHMFPVVVAGNETWTSPTVRLRVSQSFLETVLAVRADNGLGAFPPVQEKLGDRYQAVARAPLFHLTAGFTDRPFREWPELLAELPAPALLVIAAYWPGGFHGYYPDILPPDPEQGTIEELRAAVVAARTRGNLVMPMVLTSWWHEDSPTMKDLPPPLTARDIAVIDELGEPVRISWTLGDRVDWGYDVSPYHPFVRQRLDGLFEQIEDVFQADMVYEDVIGAEPLAPDFNPSAPRAGFSIGWYEHVRERRDAGIVNESGTDMLAESATGFLGSGLNAWERMDRQFGTGSWRMYPLAPLLVHDKVLFYQYWATSAVSRAYLAWNLALGYMLNDTLIAEHMIGVCGEAAERLRCPPSEPMDGPWPGAVFEFQSRVASRYAGEQMTNYVELPDGVTRSEFESVTVIRNWNPDREHTTGGFSLPPEGVLVTSASGDLTAGIFTGYNGATLSPGDHYLIEERSAQVIEVRQPIGADTKLVLKPFAAGGDSVLVRVTAFTAGGEAIGEVPSTVTEAGIQFNYRAHVGAREVAYYRVQVASPVPISTPGEAARLTPRASPTGIQAPALTASPSATVASAVPSPAESQAPAPVAAPARTGPSGQVDSSNGTETAAASSDGTEPFTPVASTGGAGTGGLPGPAAVLVALVAIIALTGTTLVAYVYLRSKR